MWSTCRTCFNPCVGSIVTQVASNNCSNYCHAANCQSHSIWTAVHDTVRAVLCHDCRSPCHLQVWTDLNSVQIPHPSHFLYDDLWKINLNFNFNWISQCFIQKRQMLTSSSINTGVSAMNVKNQRWVSSTDRSESGFYSLSLSTLVDLPLIWQYFDVELCAKFCLP